MDKNRSWVNHKTFSDRKQPEYISGIEEFLDFAFSRAARDGKIICPCLHCNNSFSHNRDTVWLHLMEYGIIRDYVVWDLHGEERFDESESESDDIETDEVNYGDGVFEGHIGGDDMGPMICDIANATGPRYFHNVESTETPTEDNEVREKFCRLLRDAEKELFPGCKSFSKLEFIVNILHIKCLSGWSDKSFSMLLDILKRAFDDEESFPKNSYEAKKYTRELGLSYVKIDACKNDCVLFYKEYADLENCPVCGCCRWKDDGEEDGSDGDCSEIVVGKKKISQKVLRHFPLIPRLQKLFMSSQTASQMRWHKEKRIDDMIIRHPADSEAWKAFDQIYPDFAEDARNVRLGLASDGFNPYGNLSSSYSMWPVILVPYNLPPWMCMKSCYMMMSLLIPGPKAPGNDIDVYLQPLIDELQQLWNIGADTFDASKSSRFKLRAALLWTINDFPAYANLSGWSTKGALACPTCNKDTCSRRLKYGRKFCYMGHRRFLEPSHRWRFDKKAFDGTIETRSAPKCLSGEDVLDQLVGCDDITFGKWSGKKRKRNGPTLNYNWKKKSIFFQLPYWEQLLLRHNLDVMHIEKNICDNILGTLFDIVGKTKDNLNSRLDLQEIGIRKDLHPIRDGAVYRIPRACYTLSLNERKDVCNFLNNVKVPDGYSSNTSRWVNVKEGKVSGMKSHDCHVFMQDLLIPAFRGIFQKEVYGSLVDLSLFFKQLCSKTLKVETLEQMDHNIAITLCKLEKYFPPSFFDIMVHLPIHLAKEAKLGGPVQYRWMYPFEREMHKYISYVRNKARPEGSIAEAYIADECLTFCSRYLSKVETRFNRMERNEYETVVKDGKLSVFSKSGKQKGKGTIKDLSHHEWRKAQLYILKNCEEAQPFLDEYESGSQHGQADFCSWFESRITELRDSGDERATEQLLFLAQGPLKRVISYEAYVVNGFRFHTKKREKRRKTQNSGVVVKGDVQSGEKDYFGTLIDVIELEYLGNNKIVLFKCDWYDVYNDGRGIKVDSNGTITINTKRYLGTDEPFVLSSQVEQVYYVNDNTNLNWCVVVRTTPRNYYDVPHDELSDEENDPQWNVGETSIGTSFEYSTDASEEQILLVRNDIMPEVVEAGDDVHGIKNVGREKDTDLDFINDDDDDIEDIEQNEEAEELMTEVEDNNDETNDEGSKEDDSFEIDSDDDL